MAQTVDVIKVCRYADYAVVQWKNQWVACWCPRVVVNETERRQLTIKDTGEILEMDWGQGHYFQHLEDALNYALDREEETFMRQNVRKGEII